MSLDKYDYDKLQDIKKLQEELLEEQKRTNELLWKIIERLALLG